METIKDKAAIVGVGVHKFSKDSGLTEIEMACRSIKSALEDADLTPDCIDGFIKYTEEQFDEIAVTRAMGIGNLTYYGELRWDGGAGCSMMQRAAMGVASGAAGNIVVVRSVNDSSLKREKRDWGELRTWTAVQETFYNPYGLFSDEGRLGMNVRRYIHEHKINKDTFGWITEVARENGAGNPRSIFYGKPIKHKDYLASKITVDPFRELDCAPAVDGAIAFIVTSAERARRISKHPVYISAGAQSIAKGAQFKTSYYRPSITKMTGTENVGKRLFKEADVTHKDIDVVQVEDQFAPLVPMQLEDLGFCERGKGVAFIEGGDRIRPDGELPLNTSGGSIGEGHLHGVNHIAEAVYQLRGTSFSQVKDAKTALIATGPCGPASGLILRR